MNTHDGTVLRSYVRHEKEFLPYICQQMDKSGPHNMGHKTARDMMMIEVKQRYLLLTMR